MMFTDFTSNAVIIIISIIDINNSAVLRCADILKQ